MSSTSPVGTIAYIIDEEALLVRVNKGWQYIAVSVGAMNNAEVKIIKLRLIDLSHAL